MSSKKGIVLPHNEQIDNPTSFETQNISDIVTEIEVHHNSIHNAVARSFGIDAWFSAYISSVPFSSISEEHKRKALEAYNGVRHILRTIERNQRDIN